MKSRPFLDKRPRLVALAAVAASVIAAAGQAPDRTQDTVTVDLGRPGAAISPTMFGMVFEDINFAADRGLYPERVKNRSFEFDEPPGDWRRDFSAWSRAVGERQGAHD